MHLGRFPLQDSQLYEEKSISSGAFIKFLLDRSLFDIGRGHTTCGNLFWKHYNLCLRIHVHAALQNQNPYLRHKIEYLYSNHLMTRVAISCFEELREITERGLQDVRYSFGMHADQWRHQMATVMQNVIVVVY